jgi:ribulose-phosphate 3-epimerase
MGIISASMMCADQTKLGDELMALEKAGIRRFHFDIMDGQYVPNMTFGPSTVAALRYLTKNFFELHLMVNQPEGQLEIYLNSGVDLAIFHLETCRFPHRLAQIVRSKGIGFGVAINPTTNITSIEHLINYTSQILIMAVDPGYAGQEFIKETYQKVRQLKNLVDSKGLNVEIAVDGNINENTIPGLVKEGASVFVGGSSGLFNLRNYKESIQILKKAMAMGEQIQENKKRKYGSLI